MKDCSVMISLGSVEKDDEEGDNRHFITLPNGKKFVYSAKVRGFSRSILACVQLRLSNDIFQIVDLDPKSPKNLVSAYKRLHKGAQLIKKSKVDRPPCIGNEKETRRVSSAPPFI